MHLEKEDAIGASFRCPDMAGISMLEAERRAGMSKGMVYKLRHHLMENDHGGRVSVQTVVRIAHACGYRVLFMRKGGAGDGADDMFELVEEAN